MAFFKFRALGPQANEGRSAAPAVPAESVETMRRRARHRLLGAAVLVLVGVVGFPLLFDTQPRPISVDIPIEIPDRNKVKPLALPATPAPTATASAPDPGARAPSAPGVGGLITESADGNEIVPSRPMADAPSAAVRPAPAPEVKAEVKPEPKPERKPEAKPAKPAVAADDGARARALLDGRGADASGLAARPVPPATAAATAAAATPADDAGRFVVQVGAFADADKAREVRQKLEKAGLKTYTHVAKTAEGDRTRVRIGPFASRADADKAAAKVKGLALSAAVLTL